MEWAKYFDKQSIKYIFFSAAIAKRLQEEELEKERLEKEALDAKNIEDEETSQLEPEIIKPSFIKTAAERVASSRKEREAEDKDEEGIDISDQGKIRVYSVDDLLDLFMDECASTLNLDSRNRATVGFVGYPNVGKSSTLNAICGAKRVAVASTPGKTKHFQVSTYISCVFIKIL